VAFSVHAGFKIKSISDGTLYRAQVMRRNGSEFRVDGKSTKTWESAQCMDAATAVGQAIYAIDCGKIKE
jgi:hypothetical protein